jgi:hypothetical protein
MNTFQGHVQEILLDEFGNKIAWLHCPDRAIPAPGRYVMAWQPYDLNAPLATPLFASSYRDSGFLAVADGDIPWEPGDLLQLRGPLGHGFKIPSSTRKLALGVFNSCVARLLPLIEDGLKKDVSIALFMDGPLPELSKEVEIHPLSVWQDALLWADFLTLELPLGMDLRSVLGLQNDLGYLGPPGQVLYFAQMPCGGLADCGVCALGKGRNWKMVCKEGPVFNIGEILNLSI